MTTSSPTNSRDHRLDLIRALAIFGTIAIHSVHEIFARYDFAGGTTWWLANLLNSMAKVSIPFFIMLSGALLFDKLDTWPSAWQRVRRRLLPPLVFWVLLYRLIDTLWFGKAFDAVGLYHLALNGNVFIFYFMVILAGAYLVTPFFNLYAQKHGTAFLQRSMFACFAIGAIFTISSYLLAVEHSWWNSTTMWLPYYGYFLAGHLMYKLGLGRRISFATLAMLAVFAGAGLLLANYMNSLLVSRGVYLFWHAQGFGVQYFDEYLNPLTIMLSLALFALMLRWKPAVTGFQSILNTVWASVSMLSFGMYATHSVVLQVLEHRFLFTTGNESIGLLPLLIGKLTITIAASWVLSYIISFIPYFNTLTGVSKQSG